MNLLNTLYPEWLAKENRAQVLTSLSNTLVDTPWESLPEDPQSVEDLLRIMSALPKHPVPQQTEHPVAVILAGGRGSRMQANVKQKALCPIHGRPALLWAMDTYRNFGIQHFVIVVGSGYKDVLDCLGTGDSQVTFLYQEEQLGTGHAARLAARYLRFQGFEGSILVAMGDKFITPQGLNELMPNHAQAQADLTLATASKTAWPDSGRVVIDETGRVCAIVEKPDVIQRQLVEDFYSWPVDPVPSHEFLHHVLQCWNRPEKLRKILGNPFWQVLHEQSALPKSCGLLPLSQDELPFEISETLRLRASEIEERCRQVNISVYVFKSRALYEAVERLKANNAQGELYLTDAVHDLTRNHHANPYRIAASQMPGDYDVMGFNTQEELAEIERRVSMKRNCK